MNASGQLLQLLANRLMRVATAVWPAQQSEWRDAACAEFAVLRKPAPALAWALGCCRAAVQQSLITGSMLQFRWTRWPLAIFALGLAHDHWFSGRLIRALHTEPSWALQFLTTAQAAVVSRMPTALGLLFALTGLCYAFAAYRLLRPGQSIFAWYGAASLGSLLGMLAYSGYAFDIGAWHLERQATGYLHWLVSASMLLLLHRYARTLRLRTSSTNIPPGD